MWTVPSRGRPASLARLVAAGLATGLSTSGLVLVDEDDPCLSEYLCLTLPKRWEFVVGKPGGLSGIYNNAYQNYRDRMFYGWLADDVVPVTNGWDIRLIEAAGSDGMSVPAGGHDPNGAPHFVLGGDLVRSMGWLSLPGLDRLYIDTCWMKIAEARGVLRRVPDVVLEHLHFSNGKALFDLTYKKLNKKNDRLIYEKWLTEFSL